MQNNEHDAYISDFSYVKSRTLYKPSTETRMDLQIISHKYKSKDISRTLILLIKVPSWISYGIWNEQW